MSDASKSAMSEDSKASTISKEEIIKLAKLSNLELSEEEISKYQTEVSSILAMITKLKGIDTTGVEPTYQVSGNQNVMREDTISEDLVPAKKLLNLAPKKNKDQLEVPKVL
jgi:aspartyl-tRNA(Asn)/glutamyl-tRNA(Gln) amidotransferase subunit C